MNAPNPYAPPRAAVDDVVSSDVTELAGRGTRLGAAIVDGLIAGAVIYGPLMLTGDLSSSMARAIASQNPMLFYGGFMGAGGAIALVGCVILIWVTIVLVSRNGQTIGKKLLNIKVVRSDGSKATLARIFWLRNVVNTLIGIIPLYTLVDHLFIFGEKRQCLHDKIADTIVVRA